MKFPSFCGTAKVIGQSGELYQIPLPTGSMIATGNDINASDYLSRNGSGLESVDDSPEKLARSSDNCRVRFQGTEQDLHAREHRSGMRKRSHRKQDREPRDGALGG
jgi:hypothetical protein